MSVSPVYTIREEIAHSITHGIGALAAVAGLVLLSLKARGILGGHREDFMDNTAVLIFSGAMIGMFLASTLYHAVQYKPVKRILRIFDHSAIFLFIAGTYTPFCLIGLKGAWGWSIFAVEWSLAILGITLNVLDCTIFKKIKLLVYILMGWVIAVGFVPLTRSVPAISIILLVAGGVLYTVGTFWYRKKDTRHTHTIWHVFVLLGTVCHWFSVWRMMN